MENNYLELLLGKDRYEKEERFKQALLDIEKEYIEFFKSRPSKHIGEEHIEFSKSRTSRHIGEDHDRLHDHWLMIGDNYTIKFGFENDTDLPREIINKCLESFNKIFNT